MDFDLDAAGVRGEVVDQDGAPIEGARVTLMQTIGGTTDYRRSSSDADGRFEYAIQSGGLIQLLASKKGYEASGTVDVTTGVEGETSPVKLVLQRLDSIGGRVVNAAGSPAAGVTVSSYRAAGLPVRQGDGVTDGAGTFSVPRSPGGATRLFVSGPGCPLRFVDLGADDNDVLVTCGAEFASVNLKLAGPDARPLQGEWVFLRWNGVLVPRLVLMIHFAEYSMPWTTDGSGSLSIVAISPGDYDVFLGQGSSEYSIAEGQAYGFLGSVHADAGVTTEVALEIGGPHASVPAALGTR